MKPSRLQFISFFIILALVSCTKRDSYEMLEQAYVWERGDEPERALELFVQAAEMLPDPYVRTELAIALVRHGSFEEAIAELEFVLQEEPLYANANRALAAAYAGLEDVPTALQILADFSQRVPGHIGIERDLIHLYMVEDMLDLAVDRLETVRERRPQELWVHLQLGHLYFQLQAFDQAERSYNGLLEIEPENPAAHAALGNTYYELEQTDAAIESYQRAIDLNPRDHRSMNNLAWAFAVENIRIQDGIRLSRRSLRMQPGSPTYLDTLAELYYKRGDSVRALELVERALTKVTEDDVTLIEHLNRQRAKFQAAGLGRV